MAYGQYDNRNYTSAACEKVAGSIQGGLQGVESKPATGLESIMGRASSILISVQHQGARLSDIDARLTGEKPKPECGNGCAPSPGGQIGVIIATLDAITARLQETDEVVSSINRTV